MVCPHLKILWHDEDVVDIYVFEVHAKYISSNVLKTSIFSWVRSTSENADIFNTWDKILLLFTEQK